jgi:large subunit ribosomal protein L18
MIKSNPRLARQRRHIRVRKTVEGTTESPRLCVFRSLNHVYAQVVDDTKGETLAAASTLDQEIAKQVEGKKKMACCQMVGELIAKRAMEKGIKAVVFDRGGYLYHGRVKSLADAARKQGLKF